MEKGGGVVYVGGLGRGGAGWFVAAFLYEVMVTWGWGGLEGGFFIIFFQHPLRNPCFCLSFLLLFDIVSFSCFLSRGVKGVFFVFFLYLYTLYPAFKGK